MEKIQAQWWKKKSEEVPGTIFGIVNFLLTNQATRYQDNLDYMRLYSNRDVTSMASDAYGRINRKDRLTLNVVQSCVDTLQAKIAKARPRPMFLTDGADWEKQQKAKKQQKFCDGAAYEVGLFQKGPQIFKDAAIFGDGFLKWYEANGRICCERVFPNEISVDDADGIYGEPRSLYQTKTVSREVLLDAWPEYKNRISNAAKSQNQQFTNVLHLADQVTVIEAWHLPSGPDAKDGKHVIVIDNQELMSEEWTKPFFPFSRLSYSERLLGYFSQGLAEQLISIQIELNKLLRTLQLSMHLLSVPKVFVENGSKIAVQQINNEIGGIIKYTGTKPIYEAISGTPPDIAMQIEKLYQRAYEIAGISQLSATSKKPDGLDSGKAIREYSDIETERFVIVGQKYEQFFIDCYKQIISLAKDIYDRDGKLASKAISNKGFEEINWKEVDLDEDDYVIQLYPTSMLSKTPAGRLQDVQELLQAGFISQEQGMKLLDFPDLQNVMDLKNAPYDDIEDTIGRMLEKGEYFAPEPYQNLSLALELTQLHYNKAKKDGLPEERLELLRRYMSDIMQLQGIGMEAQAPSPTMQPLGVPETPPVSDMLPLQNAAVGP